MLIYMDIADSLMQKTTMRPIGDFLDFFKRGQRPDGKDFDDPQRSAWNVLSFEISEIAGVAAGIRSPQFVRECDWAERFREQVPDKVNRMKHFIILSQERAFTVSEYLAGRSCRIPR